MTIKPKGAVIHPIQGLLEKHITLITHTILCNLVSKLVTKQVGILKGKRGRFSLEYPIYFKESDHVSVQFEKLNRD
ncbi:MAG: hypothetical protein ACOCYO_04610 [Bacteroidota bacterium]